MNEGRARKVVVAALIREGRRVLLAQRRADQPMPLLWELPGGKLESGESPSEGLRREIEEELGCAVAVGQVYEVVFHAYPSFDLLMLVYECSLEGAEPRPLQVAQVAWVEPGRMSELDLLPADRGLARRLAEEDGMHRETGRRGDGEDDSVRSDRTSPPPRLPVNPLGAG